ncbi:sugar ABC transporter permease [Microbacterium marinum]|uniref:carbohydrate ABC transporter permease n=1 Tax=Microbacterium marinum TaxID=421115 RepID=UPI003850E177
MTTATLTRKSQNRKDAEPRRKHPAYKRREFILQILCITPPILLLIVLIGYPLVQTLFLSVSQSTLINPEPIFVGFQNFATIFATSQFWSVLVNSIIWTIGITIGQTVLGMLAALILNRRFLGRTALRALVVIPWVMPGVIAGVLWKLLYDPSLGPIDQLLSFIGLGNGTNFLGDPSTALLAVMVVAIWKGFPLSAVMYTAAYQNVPEELREAARLDGAGPWRIFTSVVLPSMAPTIRSTVLLTTVWTFNYFDLTYVMTQGGPGNSTEIFPTAIYRIAFQDVNYGLSSAYGVISVAILSIFTVLYLRQLNKSGNLGR